jgi:hypothetical protein
MAINRGLFATSGLGAANAIINAAVVGAGAAAPTVPATTVYPAGENAISRVTADIPTRSAEGIYVLTLGPSTSPPRILNILSSVIGPDGRKCSVTSWDVAARTVTIKTWSVAGIADDLESTDTLILTIVCQNSLS